MSGVFCHYASEWDVLITTCVGPCRLSKEVEWVPGQSRQKSAANKHNLDFIGMGTNNYNHVYNVYHSI